MSLRQFVLSLAMLPLKVGFLGGWLAILLVWERILPAAPRPDKMGLSPASRIGGNVTLGLMNSALWFTVTLPLTVIAIGQTTERGFFEWRGTWATGVAGLMVDLLILDLFAYFWHRASHEVEVLWRFHAIHHRDEFLDATTGMRFHFGEIIFGSAFRAIIVCAAATPLENVIIVDLLVLVMNWFSHSNLRLPAWYEKTLTLLFVTPDFHWPHHRALKADVDQNFGVIFTFWDFLFRTRAERGRRIGMLVGIRHEADMPLGELLILPFRKQD